MDDDQRGGRVLLVDDDAMIRMLASESLRHAGFAVSEADCGEQAVRLFEAQEFDLIVLDVMMPGVDGYQVSRRIRQHERGQWLPILMLTGLNDGESIELAYRSGATDFITKPVNWMSSGEHSYNDYLKKIQCVDGYLEYDTETHTWKEVKNE